MTSYYIDFLGTPFRHACIVVLGISFIGASPAAQAQSGATNSNTITGTITVLDEEGLEMEDRSNVIVFIDGVPEELRSEQRIDSVSVSQKDRIFAPRVLPIAQGASIDFLNDDNVYHNVFSLSEANTFDLGFYPEGTSKAVTFGETGLVHVYCNIHPNMVSTILVLNNTLFTTTNADGEFEISNIPDGRFTLRVWREYSEELNRDISVGGGTRLTEAFTLTETGGTRSHTNKFGKRYRAKY